MKITVLGAGAWGTALARLLHQGKNDVTLWGQGRSFGRNPADGPQRSLSSGNRASARTEPRS